MSVASNISVALVTGSLVLLASCHKQVSDRAVGPEISIQVPLGLPPVPIPPHNPPTADSIALGRILFYDKHLSVDGTLACASCHNPRYSFTDGLNLSRGVGGATGVRNAPTILNAAYLPFQFWDGRAISMEQQAAAPIVDPLEMHQTTTACVARLASEPGDKEIFKKTFGTSDITIGRVENALASFERTVLSGNSAFDRYEYAGDKSALTPAQIRGLSVFLDPSRGNCAACHSVNSHFALFTDGKFHNTGEGAGEDGEFADVGRYHETKVSTDTGAFKTPTLRDIAKTPPYMHDGHLKTLQEVVDFYAGGGNSNPYLDPEMKKIHLSAQDRLDLVEFLQSLNAQIPSSTGPPETRYVP
jgi:cytochrome c peroxidase